jgi:hypothetical protein
VSIQGECLHLQQFGGLINLQEPLEQHSQSRLILCSSFWLNFRPFSSVVLTKSLGQLGFDRFAGLNQKPKKTDLTNPKSQ